MSVSLPYLVPVLLDTAFSTGRESLKVEWLGSSTNTPQHMDIRRQTLAISAQLFPASLICFSRSSSAGVQGVLVLLFLAGGADAGVELVSSATVAGGTTGVT